MADETEEAEFDPEAPVDPSDARLRKLKDLNAGSTAILQSLARDGVQIDQGALLAIRLNILARCILTPSELLDLDIASQEAIQENLLVAERQVRLAKLAAPAAGIPADILTRR